MLTRQVSTLAIIKDSDVLSRALFFVDFGVLQHNRICVRVVRTRSLFSDKFAGNYKSMFLLGQLITLAFLELEEQPLLAALSFTGSRIYADYVITFNLDVLAIIFLRLIHHVGHFRIDSCGTHSA